MWAAKESFYMTFTYWKWAFTEDKTKVTEEISVPNPGITYASHIPHTLAIKLNNCSPSFTSKKLFWEHIVNPAWQPNLVRILFLTQMKIRALFRFLVLEGRGCRGRQAEFLPGSSSMCPHRRLCFPSIACYRAPSPPPHKPHWLM